MSNSYDPSAVTIAVMGATGSGKSTFINLVSEESNLAVGKGLESCTSEVQVSQPFEIEGRIVTLIDTPGFDDTVKSEAEILRLITRFLAETYKIGRKLNGVIFLHRITDVRMGGVARKNFHLFKKLCGDDALKSVVIATNMWGGVEPGLGEQREIELASNDKFFKPALEKGSKLVRHDNTRISAENIIREIMGYPRLGLSIQIEVVDQHKSIGDTSAGQDLKAELEAEIEKQKEEKKKLQEEMDEVLALNDKKHQEELDDLKTSLHELNKELQLLENTHRQLREENDAHRKEHEEQTKQLMAAMEERENQLRVLRGQSAKQTETVQTLEERLVSAEERTRSQTSEKEKADAALKKLAQNHQQEITQLQKKLEAERKDRERQDRERQDRERQDRERQEKEKKEREKRERERREREREKEEREKEERERQEREKQEKEKRERERQVRERERQERERQEREKQEKERREREKREKERQEKERKERQEREKQEREKQEREKREKERRDREGREREAMRQSQQTQPDPDPPSGFIISVLRAIIRIIF
ncbi:unnamed protein product [Somion occarium]|uniref:G domain-containing protein n=1 Tax=Somion occarium TaxID=3059160 RepID=A0ABP1EBG1_9APHY